MCPLFTPDFSEAAEDLAPGTYQVRITNCEEKTSQAGNTYLKWTLDTINEQDPKNNGRKLWHNTMLSGKGVIMLKRFWDAATDGADMGTQFDSEQLLGKELSVTIDKNEKGYAEVKAVKSIQ
jgi:hypothetical protein